MWITVFLAFPALFINLAKERYLHGYPSYHLYIFRTRCQWRPTKDFRGVFFGFSIHFRPSKMLEKMLEVEFISVGCTLTIDIRPTRTFSYSPLVTHQTRRNEEPTLQAVTRLDRTNYTVTTPATLTFTTQHILSYKVYKLSLNGFFAVSSYHSNNVRYG